MLQLEEMLTALENDELEFSPELRALAAEVTRRSETEPPPTEEQIMAATLAFVTDTSFGGP
jgi:hypothetical protein